MRLALPLLGLGLLLGLVPVGARADEDEDLPQDVPVEVHATVDDSEVATLGRWNLHLAFDVLEDVGRPYRIDLQLRYRGTTLVDLGHAPEPPTPQWKKGARVAYDVPVPVPAETGLEPGAHLDLTLAFYDPAREAQVAPRVATELWGREVPLARLDLPAAPEADDPAHVERVVAAARTLAEGGRKADAWTALEVGLRRAQDDVTKHAYRDALLALAPYEPAPPSIIERQIVKARIAEERRRYLRLMSSRYYREKKLYAALRLLEEVGGTLEEDVDAAVIGALDEAKRTERDIIEIERRILATGSEEDEAAAREAIDRYHATERLFHQAEAWLKKGLYARARSAFRTISTAGKGDLSARARERLDATERAWLDDTPAGEARLVEEAKHNPAFERLATTASQRFLFIGPRKLVEGIPPESRLRFDLAYVFLTDLFGRRPNPGGDRITVYFKELWDFGGGQGGGKRIDIGRADADQVGYRVDTGLLYHELTHCVDDTTPIYQGYREGLADFGAVYAFEALGQKEGQYQKLRQSLDAFQHDYVERDIPYWRIQNYAVSAGFFLHFVDAYSKTADGHDWKPYRRFFREYRAAPVRDAREPCLVRALAYYLVRAFGPPAFDDLMRYRLPLVESDRKVVGKEVEAFAHGEHRVPFMGDAFAAHPNSPIPRDLRMREAVQCMQRQDAAGAREHVTKGLGVIVDWWVAGPFAERGSDPRAYVFPPEYEIDFEKSYPNGLNTCKWWKVAPEGVVSVSPLGWVSFNFSYMDHTATYALTHVTVPEDQTVHVHVRADDDLALFVNDRRVADYVARPDTSSHTVWWRGLAAMAPDAQRFEVRLHAGRNKILLKVRNRFGRAGFVLGLSRPDGTSIPGLRVDMDPPDPTPPRPSVSWHDVVDHSFRTKSYGRKLEGTVGTWKVEHKLLVGRSTDKGVPWRKYTVRPGFPKDSPSNLFWFRDKYTENLDDFRLRLDLAVSKARPPKLVVAFEGEGGDDVLGGWALILEPRKDGKVRARLERYEMLLYLSPDVALPEPDDDAPLPLVLTLHDDRLDVHLGDATVLEGVSIRRIPGRHRIGVATWGPQPGLAGFELEKPK